MSVTNTLSIGQSKGKPQLRTLSATPSWRQNSKVRTLNLEHLGRQELVLALLDQQGTDAAPAEIGGERQPDRAGADDQHRRFDGGESR